MKNQTAFALLVVLALALSSCGTTPPAVPTLLPTLQTVIPTDITYPAFIPTPLSTAISYPTVTPLPTEIPYPTASVVNANAVAFIEGNSLWVANVDGSGERKLTDIENNVSQRSNHLLQWSPDGKWISYISGDDLWIISPDGSIKRKTLLISKTNKNRIESYSWSPDDSKIAYIDSTSGSPMPRLLDLNTGDISEPLLDTPQFSVSWSPNGRYILLNTYTSMTIFEVATSKVLKEINSVCPIIQHKPVWSPNNEWFYHPTYAGSGKYRMQVCVSGLDGSNRWINIMSSSYLPVWDKTGNFLYFTTNETNTGNIDTNQRLLRYDIRTQEAKPMLSLEVDALQHIWSVSISPNGHILEMDSSISENRQLFIFLDLDSASMKKSEISEMPISYFFYGITVWSADSQNIIFLSQSNGCFYKLDIQTGKTTIISGKHSVESWVVSPVATTP